jgi:hypothetical protein
VCVELDTRHPSEPASGFLAVRRDRARAVFGQAMGLVALTVGCLALGAYMDRDLTGGAGLALSVGAVICLVGLNSARPTGAITHDHASVRTWLTGSDRSPRATPARRAPPESATRIAHRAGPRDSGIRRHGRRRSRARWGLPNGGAVTSVNQVRQRSIPVAGQGRTRARSRTR